jgi:hypothetical protein
MDPQAHIHQTARRWYLVKAAKGEEPRTVLGGALDGLHYYQVEVDGVYYWLTEVGLFTPPEPEGDSWD